MLSLKPWEWQRLLPREFFVMLEAVQGREQAAHRDRWERAIMIANVWLEPKDKYRYGDLWPEAGSPASENRPGGIPFAEIIVKDATAADTLPA